MLVEDNMDVTLEVFTERLSDLSKFSLLETVREQANSLVKDGNPYFAALLREIANRYEESRRPV